MHPHSERVTLAELGIDEDPGTTWHPAAKSGDLPDLTEAEVAEHLAKPEAAEQVDAGRSLAAEDSAQSPEGEV